MCEKSSIITNKEVRKLVEEIQAGVEVLMVTQHRPVTLVLCKYTTSFGDDIIMLGYSKVSWPDQWSPEKGLRIAIDRAITWNVRDTFAALDAQLDEVIENNPDKDVAEIAAIFTKELGLNVSA